MMPKRWLPTILTTTRLLTQQTTNGLVLEQTNSQDVNKARRQDLKRQQRPMNPMQAVADEEEQISYSDEDINQGF